VTSVIASEAKHISATNEGDCFGVLRTPRNDESGCFASGCSAAGGASRGCSSAFALGHPPNARLQNLADVLISAPSLLEPGRICMISSYSRIAPARPKLMPDALLAG
jgi:hypothetical protein